MVRGHLTGQAIAYPGVNKDETQDRTGRPGWHDVRKTLIDSHIHDFRVHCFRMKNITLSADEQLIEQARLLAKSRHKTLNALFREWLEQFTAQSGGVQEFDALMKRLKHVQAGRRFSRDEMNER
jgi:hypothetical protein